MQRAVASTELHTSDRHMLPRTTVLPANGVNTTSCSTIPTILSCGETRLTVSVLLDSGMDASYLSLSGPPTGSRHIPAPVTSPHWSTPGWGGYHSSARHVADLRQPSGGASALRDEISDNCGLGSGLVCAPQAPSWLDTVPWSPSCHASNPPPAYNPCLCLSRREDPSGPVSSARCISQFGWSIWQESSLLLTTT